MRTILLSTSLALVLVGCGDDGTTPAIDAGDSVDAAAEIDASPPACATGDLCLTVVPTAAGLNVPDGRLVVVWFQLNDDAPTPDMKIGYDAPFDPASPRVDLRVGDIATPDDVHLLCQRACADEVMCPCLDDLQAGIAFVLVAGDIDGNGQIDVPAEIDSSDGPVELIGFGTPVMGYSAVERMPTPAPLDSVFVDGLLQGVAPYVVTPPAGSGFDQLSIPQQPTEFELHVCEPDTPSCGDLPFPNLS